MAEVVRDAGLTGFMANSVAEAANDTSGWAIVTALAATLVVLLYQSSVLLRAVRAVTALAWGLPVTRVPSPTRSGLLFFVWLLLSNIGAGRADLIAAFRNPFVSLAAVAATLSITWHMRLGVEAVVEDYVHGQAGKVLLALNTLFALAVAIAILSSVLWLALGA